jgi:hypothetical protein
VEVNKMTPNFPVPPQFEKFRPAYEAMVRPTNVPSPLPPTGALAALLVVEGLLDIKDAANAVRVKPEQLVTEALGWAAGAALNSGNE